MERDVGCCCLCVPPTSLGLQACTWRWALGSHWLARPAAGKMSWTQGRGESGQAGILQAPHHDVPTAMMIFESDG